MKPNTVLVPSSIPRQENGNLGLVYVKEELVVLTCPVCGSDETSVASNGEIYCVDCNRIYLVLELHGSEHGYSALALKPADSLRNHNLRAA